MKTNQQEAGIWRWLAFGSVLGSIAFSYLSNTRIINGQNNADVSAQYPTLFTPAGYAFSIWGLIYLSLIVYVVYQLLPGQRQKRMYDTLAKPLTVISLLSIGWLIVFNSEWLLLSVALIIGMLIAALVLQVRAKQEVSLQSGWQWVTVPFSLYAGWLTVATIANVTIYLTSIGWQGTPLSEETWTIVMITIAFAIGIGVSWRLRDVIYPLVIAWASVAIWVARRDNHEQIAVVAVGAAILLVAWAIFWGIRLARHPYRTVAG